MSGVIGSDQLSIFSAHETVGLTPRAPHACQSSPFSFTSAEACGKCINRRQKMTMVCDPFPPAAPEKLPRATSLEYGRRHALYRLVRIALFIVSAALFVSSLSAVVRHADTLFYLGEMQLPQSDQEVEKTVT